MGFQLQQVLITTLIITILTIKLSATVTWVIWLLRMIKGLVRQWTQQNNQRKKDTDSEIKSNSNVSDSDVEINEMYGNSQICPNVYGIDGFYERYKSFGSTHTCIDNDIYSYIDGKSRESKSSWKDWTKQDWRVC